MIKPTSQRISSPKQFSQQDRQQWMAVLANATLASLEEKLSLFGDLPGYRYVRSPEIGLTMVRGRAGGTGQSFNLGEMTLTRCVVRLENLTLENLTKGKGINGFGYVSGRSQRHAELAAVCDALLQHSDWHPLIYEHVLFPLAQEANTRQVKQSCQTEATKVDFLTMLRGEVS